MSSEETPRALYRFDPHDEGIWLGLGLVRLAMVCGSMLLGALALYAGRIVPALLLLVLVPPCVLARWDGLPLLSWVPLRVLYRLQGPREWAIDPEHTGFVTPLSTWVPAISDTPTANRQPPVADQSDDEDEVLRRLPTVTAVDATPETDGEDLW